MDLTYPQLAKQLAEVGAQMLLETLNNFDELSAKAVPQPDVKLPYAKKFKTSDANIKWADWTALQVYGRWRSMPRKAYTFCQNKCVKLVKMVYPQALPQSIIEKEKSRDFEAGYLIYDKPSKLIFVKCKEGWIGVQSLHLATRAIGRADAFANGFQLRQEHNCKFEFLDRLPEE